MNQKINCVVMEYCWKYNKSGHEPFNWMVNDLWRCIQAEENYLVALGLFTYSETLGRLILGTIGNSASSSGLDAYREFTEKYIGYYFSEVEWRKLFDHARNGLAHRYFIKERFGSVLNEDGTMEKGIAFDSAKINIYIHSYFKHFVAGLEKYLNEKSPKAPNCLKD